MLTQNECLHILSIHDKKININFLLQKPIFMNIEKYLVLCNFLKHFKSTKLGKEMLNNAGLQCNGKGYTENGAIKMGIMVNAALRTLTHIKRIHKI